MINCIKRSELCSEFENCKDSSDLLDFLKLYIEQPIGPNPTDNLR